jgi:hypothetical protein
METGKVGIYGEIRDSDCVVGLVIGHEGDKEEDFKNFILFSTEDEDLYPRILASATTAMKIYTLQFENELRGDDADTAAKTLVEVVKSVRHIVSEVVLSVGDAIEERVG